MNILPLSLLFNSPSFAYQAPVHASFDSVTFTCENVLKSLKLLPPILQLVIKAFGVNGVLVFVLLTVLYIVNFTHLNRHILFCDISLCVRDTKDAYCRNKI